MKIKNPNQVDEALEKIYNFIIQMKNTKCSSNEFINIYDIVFELCTLNVCENVYKKIYNAFTYLKNEYLQEIEVIKDSREYLIDNPVYSDKNINRKIADYAYPTKEETHKRMLEFLIIAKTTHRITAFMARFWIPNKMNSGETLLMDDGKEITAKKVYDLAYIVWPEIDVPIRP